MGWESATAVRQAGNLTPHVRNARLAGKFRDVPLEAANAFALGIRQHS
jgi:hypothetical protein